MENLILNIFFIFWFLVFINFSFLHIHKCLQTNF